MNKPQILIVEDDNAVANLISATLETQDYAYKLSLIHIYEHARPY